MKSRYIFDAAGRLIERRYSQAPDTASNHNAVTAQVYTFDDFGRLCTIYVRVNGQEQTLREYFYDPWGRVVETKTHTNFADGGTCYIAKRYTYTDFGQIESMKYFRSTDSNIPIESFVYTYNKNGHILSEHHISNLVYPPHDEKRSYTYNENGRLIRSESTLSGIVEYGFDKVGNRRVVTTNGDREVTYYTGLDQILRKVDSAGTINFIHCPNGNLISEVSPTQTRLFSYSVDNRLTEVRQGTTQVNAGIIQTNVFRGDGQRITKQEGLQITNYTYRAGQVLYTTDEQGNRRAFNIYSPAGNIIAARQYCSSSDHQGEHVTYLTDIRGSITSIIDDEGNFIQGYRYTDYGITTRIGSGAFNEFAYTQGIWDEVTGLYYLNARFYNPVDGRFLTQDPYRGSNDQPDTWHLYGYCAGDPINWIDPSGNRMIVAGGADRRRELRNHLQRLTRYLVVLRGNAGLTREVRIDRSNRSRRPGSPRPNGNRLIRRIINHDRTVRIELQRQRGNFALVRNNQNAQVFYNPDADPLIPTREHNSDIVRMRTRAPEIGLAHELIHADRAIRGRLLSGRSNWGFRFRDDRGTRWRVVSTLREELATIGLRYHGTNDVTENQIRGERGNRLRGAY